jgi:hypothetical protein
MTVDRARTALAAAAERLAARYGHTAPPEKIDRVLHDAYERLLATSTITAYLPVLAERSAAAQLAALAGPDTHDTHHFPSGADHPGTHHERGTTRAREAGLEPATSSSKDQPTSASIYRPVR